MNSSLSPAPTPTRSVAGAALMAALLFALTLALETRHNDFPFSYHPDEGGKVRQIVEGTRNYHHPLLLLEATEYASRLAFVPRELQPIVLTGRWISAAFAAGSVAAFALLAWWNYGLLVGWGAGLAIALQEDLFEMAHYMKEDPALLFGLALALLGAHVWWRQPAKASLRFLAIGCGLATAGKYLGVVSLLFAVPLVIWHPAADSALPRAARLRSFLLFFAGTFLICNLPFFAHEISSPFRSVGNEMVGVAGGHHGLTRKIPHAEYLIALRKKVPTILAVFAGLYSAALLVTPRRRTAPEWVTLLFPVFFLGMISCSPKIADRYLLPVSAMLPLLAALGIGELGRVLESPTSAVRRAASGVIVCVLLALVVRSEMPTFSLFRSAVLAQDASVENASLFSRAYIGFQHDDPLAVAQWVREHLPPNAVIAEDHRVNLSPTKADGVSATARVPQKVLDATFAPELGSLDELKSQGVGYVVVCRQNYGRFFNDDMQPRTGAKKGYDKAKDFYTQLFKEGKLLKEWPKGPIAYLQPGIRLYQIAAE